VSPQANQTHSIACVCHSWCRWESPDTAAANSTICSCSLECTSAVDFGCQQCGSVCAIARGGLYREAVIYR